ncbi:hypothetical protein [Acetobacter malorum]|uniref:hypothetical protein n=1 Tax=Acetobacter malorum TaxID=178901 RepID=UPI00248EC038|nr:hypothetical protein [Acetobacter malorum]
MSASRLISSFEGHVYTKVDEKDVRDKILGLKPRLNHFEFCEFEKDEYPYLDGMYEEELIERGWDEGTDDAVLIGYIYTRKNLNDKEYRVIVCKEMIHSLDQASDKTFTLDAINTLSEELTLPDVMKEFSCHTMRDKMCFFLALTVLFPLSTKRKFLESYQKEEISAKEISDMTSLPEVTIPLLMSPAWQFISEKVIPKYLEEEEKKDLEGDAEEEKFFREIREANKAKPKISENVVS